MMKKKRSPSNSKQSTICANVSKKNRFTALIKNIGKKRKWFKATETKRKTANIEKKAEEDEDAKKLA